MKSYLIIGAGPAGLSAAAALRRIDPEGRVTILSNETVPPYARMVLPYLLGGTIEEKKLLMAVPEGVELVPGQEVVQVEPAARRVVTAGGRSFSYDRLLIASGASAVLPSIPGAQLPFVFTVRNLADIQNIERQIGSRSGRAIIAGAGPVGMEVGGALHKRGFHITYVVSSGRLFSTMLDEPASALVEHALSRQGIEIRKHEDVVEIMPDHAVRLKSGPTYACNVAIIGKGVLPAIGFLAGSGIAGERGIPVDEHQETTVPGIYAAGDVAETMDVVYGDRRCNSLWPAAVEQGRVAALNMAGRPAAYAGSLSRNIVNCFGISILAAGRGKEERPEVHRESGPDFYHKLVLNQGRLQGVIMIGDYRSEGLYLQLMERKIDVSGLLPALLRGTLSYARLFRGQAAWG